MLTRQSTTDRILIASQPSVWLSARRTGVASGQPVSSWADLVPSHPAWAQGTTAAKPTQATTGVTFDGGDWLDSAASLAASTQGLILVAAQVSASAGATSTNILLQLSNNLSIYYTPNFGGGIGGTTTGVSDITVTSVGDLRGQWHVFGFDWRPAGSGGGRLSLDGAVRATQAARAYSSTAGTGRVGHNSGSAYLNGAIGEVLVWLGVDPTAVLARAARALCARWGVAYAGA